MAAAASAAKWRTRKLGARGTLGSRRHRGTLFGLALGVNNGSASLGSA